MGRNMEWCEAIVEGCVHVGAARDEAFEPADVIVPGGLMHWRPLAHAASGYRSVAMRRAMQCQSPGGQAHEGAGAAANAPPSVRLNVWSVSRALTPRGMCQWVRVSAWESFTVVAQERFVIPPSLLRIAKRRMQCRRFAHDRHCGELTSRIEPCWV